MGSQGIGESGLLEDFFSVCRAVAQATACRTYGALSSLCEFSQAFRPGVTYAAPTALSRPARLDIRWYAHEKQLPACGRRGPPPPPGRGGEGGPPPPPPPPT